MHIKDIEKMRLFNLLAVLIMSTGLGIFLICMPKYADDLWYMVNVKDWFDVQGIWYPTDGGNIFKFGIPWEGIKRTIYEHWQTDNARLCNIVVIFFLLLPKWVGSGIALFCWICAMYYSFKLSGVDWQVSKLVPVGLALWSFTMPWSQQMGGLDYQFNYVMSSGLMLLLLYRMDKGVSGRMGYIGLFIMAFIIGLWHEGFSLPVVAGLVSVVLFCRNYRRKEVIIVISGLVLGLVLLTSAPCYADKLPREITARSYNVPALVRSILIHPAFIAFVITVALISFRKRSPEVFKDSRVIFILASGVIAVFIQFIVTQTRRTGWWADLASVPGIVYLLHSYFKAHGHNARVNIRNNVVYTLSLISVVVYWTYVDVSTLRVSRFSREVTRQYALEDEETVFKGFETMSDLPIHCFYTPDLSLFHYIPWIVHHYIYYGKEHALAVIPQSLEFIRSDDGEAIYGSNEVLRKIGQVFYTSEVYEYGEDVEALFIYANGVKRYRSFTAFPFISRADGKNYVYLYLKQDIIGDLSGEISQIEILREDQL